MSYCPKIENLTIEELIRECRYTDDPVIKHLVDAAIRYKDDCDRLERFIRSAVGMADYPELT